MGIKTGRRDMSPDTKRAGKVYMTDLRDLKGGMGRTMVREIDIVVLGVGIVIWGAGILLTDTAGIEMKTRTDFEVHSALECDVLRSASM